MIQEFLPYFLILFGIVAILLPFFTKSSNKNLKETGVPSDGIIFKQEKSRLVDIDGNRSFIKDKITVRFLTKKDEWITAELSQDFIIAFTSQYKDGDTIKVFYDKNDPYKFYVESGQSEFAVRVGFAVVGIILLIAGIYKILKPL